MTIGRRLVEERKRLGFSQGDLAKKTGVSLSTQKRYEIDEREPGTSYLESIRKLGVDVAYLLTARRRGGEAAGIDFDELGEFGLAVVKFLGISSDELQAIISNVSKAVRQQFAEREGDSNAEFTAYRDSFFVQASDLLRRKIEGQSGITAALDHRLLTAVVEVVEAAVSASGRTYTPERRSRLIAMVYRASHSSGKVETALLDDVMAFTNGWP